MNWTVSGKIPDLISEMKSGAGREGTPSPAVSLVFDGTAIIGTGVSGRSTKRNPTCEWSSTPSLETSTATSLKSFIAGPINRDDVLIKKDQVLFPSEFSMTFVVLL